MLFDYHVWKHDFEVLTDDEHDPRHDDERSLVNENDGDRQNELSRRDTPFVRVWESRDRARCVTPDPRHRVCMY